MNNSIIKISFNSTTEFIEELRTIVTQTSGGASNILDLKVRVTNCYLPTRLSPSIRHVSVQATAVRTGEVLQIIELKRFCGDLWGIDCTQDSTTREKVKLIHDKISLAATELGLSVAAGVFEPGEPVTE